MRKSAQDAPRARAGRYVVQRLALLGPGRPAREGGTDLVGFAVQVEYRTLPREGGARARDRCRGAKPSDGCAGLGLRGFADVFPFSIARPRTIEFHSLGAAAYRSRLGWRRPFGAPALNRCQEVEHVASYSMGGRCCRGRRVHARSGRCAGAAEDRQGRRPGRHRGLGRLHRARRDRQELRLGHRLREGQRLQGQRQDRRHLRRDGGADERRRLRPGHRLGRRRRRG